MNFRNLLIASCFASMGLQAHAEDLPNNFVITRGLSSVDVFEAKSAAVAKPKSERHDAGQRGVYVKLSGVLEINLQVQGNLCLGQASGVSYLATPINRERTALRLLVSSDNHAYSDTLYACTAHGKLSDTKIALPFRESGFEKELLPYKRVYTLQTQPFGSQQKQNIDVILTYTPAGGFKTELKPATTLQTSKTK